MRQTIEKTWDLLNVTIKEVQKQNANVILNQSAKNEYNKIFRELYNQLKNNFMNDEIKYLDRHKVASIIILSLIQSNAIVYEGEIVENKTFFGQYLIAASVGINFMLDRLNDLLFNKGEKPIKELWFPTPISCNTPYFEVFSRNLYFSDHISSWGLNPLDIAEKLFLLEYITLEKKGIDPNILKNSAFC